MRMAKPTAERTADGVVVSGMRDMPGWSVTVHDSGAVTLTPPAGVAIDTEAWRKVPLGAVLREADAVRGGDLLDALLALLARDGGDPSRSSRQGRRAHLERVSRVYRMALEHDVPPAAALARHFDADGERTTQRWITNARKEGLIGTYAEERERIDRLNADAMTATSNRRAATRGNGRVHGKNSISEEKN